MIKHSVLLPLFSILSLIYTQNINYNINLIHNITFENSSNNFGVSDVWGYTDETGIEYAIVGYQFGTSIFNVSLESPLEIANILGPSNGDYYFHRDYKTYNYFLYIVNEMYGGDIGMQVIDLSPLPDNPPIQLDTYNLIGQSHNLWIDQSGFAFIEHYSGDNIHIVNLLNPSIPIYESSFGNQALNCHDIYTKNNIAYISEGWSNEFGIYDISDILSPQKLAGIPSFGYAHNAWLNSSGTHLITGEETVGMTIKIWDIQDHTNINLVGEYLGENSLAHNVHVKDDFIYISHYTTGLKIVDIWDPSKPIEVAAYDTYPDDDNDGFYGCWGAYPFTSNGYVYASDMQYGLFILQFDNIEAGWVSGTISNGVPLANVEIQSLLNGKVFTSDINGYYQFGFPEGEQEFTFRSNGDLLGIQTIPISPHVTTEWNITFGINGDINEDGLLNVLDIVQLVNQILTNEYNQTSDINQDGVLNILDIVQLVNIILDN